MDTARTRAHGSSRLDEAPAGADSATAPRRRADEEAETLFYLAAGPGAAILLGMGLVPLREIVTASNLAFVFVVLTIAVAEFGGRWPALATALASALSLNFFLTRPYLSLTIHEKQDVLAFLGLAVSGLVAAAFGKHRTRRIARLAEARGHADLLHSVLRQVDEPGSLEDRLARVLQATREALPLSALAVRDTRNRVVASSDPGDGLRTIPDEVLELGRLLAAAARTEPSNAPSFPPEGGRMALHAGDHQAGWLDLWGNGLPASTEARRALADVGRVVALLIDPAVRTGGPEGPR